MEPSPIILFLLGLPLSVFANFSWDRIKSYCKKVDPQTLERLFVKSFYTALKRHDKHYDTEGRKLSKEVGRRVKKSEDAIVSVFQRHANRNHELFKLLSDRKYAETVARDLLRELGIEVEQEAQDEFVGVVTDCLRDYQFSFIRTMSDSEAVKLSYIELLGLRGSIDVLSNIMSNSVTREEFAEFRAILLDQYFGKGKQPASKLAEYEKYLEKRFEYIEIKGVSPRIQGKEVAMKMEEIFIPLKAMPVEEVIQTINPSRGTVDENYPSREDGSKSSKEKSELKIKDLLKQYRAVVLGDPGSGKSTLLKYLILALIKGRKSREIDSPLIPVHIRISKFAELLKKQAITFYEFVTQRAEPQFKNLVQQGCDASSLLVLIDGLDEVTDAVVRQKVVDEITDFVARFPHMQYVITSRVVGYQETKVGSNFFHVRLLPFEEKQIQAFATQWHEALSREIEAKKKTAKQEAEALFKDIKRSPSVLRLAANPLLMTIIAMIHYKGKSLPNRRIELYDICTETFLEYWVRSRVDSRSKLTDKTELIEILAPIAFEIHQTSSSGLIEEKVLESLFVENFLKAHDQSSKKEAREEFRQFIDFVQEEAGFFYEQGFDELGRRYFGFGHLTFQEYLAAIQFQFLWLTNSIDLSQFVMSARWVEVIRLAAGQLRLSQPGQMGRIKTTELLEGILNVEDHFPESCRLLQLTCYVLADDVVVADKLIDRVFSAFAKECGSFRYRALSESLSKVLEELLASVHQDSIVSHLLLIVRNGGSPEVSGILNVLQERDFSDDTVKVLFDAIKQKVEINADWIAAISESRYPKLRSQKWWGDAVIEYSLSLDVDKDYNALLRLAYMCKRIFGVSDIKDLNDEYLDFVARLKGHQQIDPFVWIVIHFEVSKALAGEGDDIPRTERCKERFGELALFEQIDDMLLNGSGLSVSAEDEWESVYSTFITWGVFGRYFVYLFARNNLVFLSAIHNKKMTINTCFVDLDNAIHNLEVSGVDFNYEETMEILDSVMGVPCIDWRNYPGRLPEIFFKGRTPLFGWAPNDRKWEKYPFQEIRSSPSLLSRGIVVRGEDYTNFNLRSKAFASDIDPWDLDDEEIAAPAKLLYWYVTRGPADEFADLFSRSVNYFRACDEKEKAGAFSILHQACNPFL